MTAPTFTVIENGRETVLPMSPEMQAIVAEMEAFNAANPDFWCRCDAPETGRIVPRGHSVDVDCRNCGGWIQIG